MSQSNVKKGDHVKLKYNQQAPLPWIVMKIYSQKVNDKTVMMAQIMDGLEIRNVFADQLILAPEQQSDC